jgi:hypothetical protein
MFPKLGISLLMNIIGIDLLELKSFYEAFAIEGSFTTDEAYRTLKIPGGLNLSTLLSSICSLYGKSFIYFPNLVLLSGCLPP